MDEIGRLLGTFGCCALPLLLFGGVLALMIYMNMNARVPGGFSRQKKMRITATRMGWSFTTSVPYTSIPGGGSLHLFSHGGNRRIGNVMSGQHGGAQMTLFDHVFTRGFAHNYFRETVVTMPKGDVALPWFVLRTSNYMFRLGVKPSDQITFPNHPKFSGLYVLMAKDEAAVRRIFTNAVIEYCETRPGLCLESAEGQLFVFREGVFAESINPQPALDEAHTVLQMLASGLSHPDVTPPPLPPPV